MPKTEADVAWQSIDTSRVPDGLPCAVGADLAPDTLLAAFRHGFFPLPTEHADGVEINEIMFAVHVELGTVQELPTRNPLGRFATVWWNPARRPVFRPGDVHLSTNLRRRLRNRLGWTTTCNTAFERVVAECAENRAHERQWLSATFAQSLADLHRQGWAHSVEVWEGEELIAGVFGIGFGGVFSMDSTFHRRPEGSKVAIADLQGRLAGSGVALLDAQMPGPLAEGLGARPVDRDDYLAALGAVDQPLRLDEEPKPAAWLAAAAG
ncbi:leucyl/phenylalanyl-tRNA--protein transferase [Kitasatospora sp. NPDC101801]|uniref:leucyl/phenylalanyl-tRNA--protein transferase n=1 Tax=Kitasatospora sp. NPDC101801 TaxID=3364103 RepID=UPI00381F10A2